MYIFNLTKDYNNKFIGQKTVASNDISINEYEKKLLKFVWAENEVSKRYELRSWEWWQKPTLHEFLSSERTSLLIVYIAENLNY